MMGTIEQRLLFLEREVGRSRQNNRILTFIIVAIVCIAGAQGTKPQQSKPTTSKAVPPADASLPDDGLPSREHRLRTVEADQFVLLDQFGRSRVRMAMTDNGPAMSMFDENGRKRLELSQTTNASGLRLFDSDKSPVVSLQLPNSVDRAHLEIKSPEGSTLTKANGFSVQDGTNKGRLRLALLNGNFPVLGISQSGQTGPPSVEITAGEDGSRSLKIHDDDGYPLFSVFAANNGKTHLNMRHPDHERSLQISAGPKDFDGPAVAFFAPANKDGTGGQLPRLQFGLRNDHQSYIRVVDSKGRPQFTAPAR